VSANDVAAIRDGVVPGRVEAIVIDEERILGAPDECRLRNDGRGDPGAIERGWLYLSVETHDVVLRNLI
jgi:hypothetical protein